MKPLISVILPIYNVAQFLPRCIESVCRQTYDNLEIILVDDGSPDECGDICEKYAEKDNRIVVVHKQNGGLSDARNKGAEIANGEYITFIDSDDYVTDTYVEYLYSLIEKYGTRMSLCTHTVVFEKGNNIIYGNKYIYNIKSRNDFQRFVMNVINTDRVVNILQQLINLAGNIELPEVTEEEPVTNAEKIVTVSDVVDYIKEHVA